MGKMILQLIGALALVGVPLTGFGLGIEAGEAYLHRMCRQPGVLVRFFLASFVIMPVIAIAIRLGSNLPHGVWIGLALISMTPPSPGLRNKALKLEGDAEVSAAWQTIALVLCVVTIPLTLVVLQTILHLDVELGIVPVLKKTLLAYAFPVLAGIVLQKLWPAAAKTCAREAHSVSRVALALLALLVILIGIKPMLSLGVVPHLVILLFVALAILVGHALGGPPAKLRPTLAAALATRWPAPAIVLARLNGVLRLIAPVVVAYILFGTVLLMLYGKWLAGRNQTTTGLPATELIPSSEPERKSA